MNNMDDFANLIESAELDDRAEQLMRDEVCTEKGHDTFQVVVCKVCGLIQHVPGISDEPV